MTSGTVGAGNCSICFVAHYAYSALVEKASGHIGGVERQQSLMAKWLAARGYRVSIITWDEDQPDGQVIDGVRILKVCRQDQGVPGLRFLHPRWTSLVRALGKADADLYYQNCGEYVTGQVALWCRRHGRRFVYSVANDADCEPRLAEMHTMRERVLYRYGLRHANRVLVQTHTQQTMLRDGFGLDSTVIPMPCPDPFDGGVIPREPLRFVAPRILWIARVCMQKRPDRLLDLAEACPGMAFDLVGPKDGSQYAQEVFERANRIPNVTVHGPATRSQVSAFYRRATCLVCTSAFEGFPNTFLEAWSFGLPVVSTFDPDRLIAERALGTVASDVPGLAAGIRQLAESPARWREVSANCRRHYREFHSLAVAMPRFESLFLDVLRSVPASRR